MKKLAEHSVRENSLHAVRKYLLTVIVTLGYYSYLFSISYAADYTTTINGTSPAAVIQGGDTVTVSGYMVRALFADGIGQSITVENGGATLTNLSIIGGTGVVTAFSGSSINLGNGTIINASGIGSATGINGPMAILVTADAVVIAQNLTANISSDKAYGISAGNGGLISLTGLTTLNIAANNATETSYGVSATYISGTSTTWITAEDIDINYTGYQGSVSTNAQIIHANGSHAIVDISGTATIIADVSVGRAVTTYSTMSSYAGGIININNLTITMNASYSGAGEAYGVDSTLGTVNVTGNTQIRLISDQLAVGIKGAAGSAMLIGSSANFSVAAPNAYGIYFMSDESTGVVPNFYSLTGASANGSTVIVNNMTADIAGITSAALIYNTTAKNGVINSVTINTGTLHSSMDGIVVDGGTLNATLNNVTLTNDSGVVFKVGSDATGTYAGNLELTASGSNFKGISTLESGSVSNVILTNGSDWTVTGDSTLSSLRNENSTVAFSSPENNVFKTLTVTNYTGNNGTLVLNTVLGTDASPSDLLVIDGGTATGTTNLVVMNAGGLGALTTGDGILVVEAINGGTTDAGAFVQSSRIAAGAYDYTLVRGGSLSADNWYLTSAYMPPDEPGGGEVPTDNGTVTITRPNYRPEIALASAIQPIAAEYGYAMLDTLHERVGDTFAIRPFEKAYEERVVRDRNGKRQVVRVPVQPSAESQKWFAGAWGRLFGNRGFQDRGGSFLKNGPKYDYTFGGIQAGLDIYGRETSAGTDKAGIYVGYGNISANVKGAYGGKAGSIDMDAYTIGAYWTHKATQGWYTDAVVQGTWYTTDATSIYGQKLKPDGFGFIASLEGGYSFDLGDGLMLEPQVQLAYQHLSFDSFSDAYGRFSIADGDSLRGRIGARLVKNWDMSETGNGPRQLTTWLRANIWHEFMGKSKTTVTDTYGLNGVTIPSNLGGTWGEIGAGASMLISENVTMFATGAYSRSLDNKGREAWDGRLGMTVKW